MMKSLRIVFALIRVPRLFASLLLFPLLGSLIIVLGQLIVSGSALRQVSDQDESFSAEKIEGETAETKDWNFIRLILYGSGDPQPAPVLCLWIQDNNPEKSERPPSAECAPDKLDVAIHQEDGLQVDYSEYLRLINGNVQRLHICKSCRPDLELFIRASGNSVKAHSSYGLMIFSLLMLNREIQSQYQSLKIQRSELKKKFGDVFFFLPELKAPIHVSRMEVSVVLILNITALVVIALWLGLRAHRKVLDYFAKSGALLPMVAATGKNSFYLALWCITTLRVALFLAASVPLMLIVLDSASEEQSFLAIFNNSVTELALWLLTLFSSMTLATLIASISDLKGRHEILSAAYKIIPLLLSAFGALIWAISFLATSENAAVFRSTLSAFPILGMGPMILAPIVQPKIYVLLFHSISSAILCWMLLKKNAHWFAAHLEEL